MNACLLVLAVIAGSDPNQDWRTVSTPNFNVHFTQGREPFARRVAALAERAHGIVVPFLKHAPSGRTEIVVADTVDAANGAASVLPYKAIVVNATGPESISELGDYDDWIWGLVVHEFTHIVHLDTVGGLSKILNALLGPQYAPNLTQPTWLIEGLAVFAESAFGGGGRAKSAFFDMHMRAAMLEGRVDPLDRVTGFTRDLPHGSLAYMYGGRFISFLAEKYGREKLAEVSWKYGARFIPHGLNIVAREVFGKDYPTLYAEWREALGERARRDLARVKSVGVRAGIALTRRGETNARPRHSPDGATLYYLSNDARSYPAYRAITLATGKDRRLFDAATDSAPTLVGSGREVLFHQGEVFRSHYSFNDLFLGDIATGVVTQVTHGLRAREPDARVSGGDWVFTVNRAGTRNVATMAPDGRGFRFVTQWTDFSVSDTPRWSPDGERVVFSAWRPRGEVEGTRDLWLWEKKTGALTALTSDRAIDVAPAWSPDGAWVYFASDRDGIYNIYRMRRSDRAVEKVTNVVTGAFDPDVSPDGKALAFAHFSARGFDVHRMELPAPATASGNSISNSDSNSNFPTTAPATAPDLLSRPYNPLPTLLPKTWSPLVLSDATGTFLGAATFGSDVLGRHAYGIRTTVGVSSENRGRVDYAVAYQLSTLTPTITLEHYRAVSPSAALVGGALVSFDEPQVVGRLSLSLPWSRREESQSFFAAYEIEHLSGVDWLTSADPADPRPIMPARGLIAGLTLGVGYSRVRSYAWSVSAEEGRSFVVEFGFKHPAFGSRYTTAHASARYAEYIPMFFRHHVLALRVQGGLGTGDLRGRRIFSLSSYSVRNILIDFIDNIRVGSVALRGFPGVQSIGDYYLLGTAEYRFPLLNVQRGIATHPLFLDRLHLSIFTDVGGAFDRLTDKSLVVGSGAELLVDLAIGHFLSANIRFGYARGFARGGGDNVYLVLGSRY